MSYRLCDGLSFCRADDHLIFLDTRSDRYFRLSVTLERAFLAHLDSDEDTEVDVGALVEHKILTTAPAAAAVIRDSALRIQPAERSAIEWVTDVERVGIATLFDVFATVGWMRWQLTRCGLNQILTDLSVYRGDKAPPSPAILTEPEAWRLSYAAALFWRARAYVPIEPRCLWDSLAMVKYLAKRRLHANLVFGVTGDPFAPHAWVQVSDLVLSDTVGNASAYTPIRVV